MYKLNDIYISIKNKVTNKIWGIVNMPAKGVKTGNVLICYFTEPFTLTPWENFSNYHTMYWECYEIAKIFSKKGYSVDIINANDDKFIPSKKYNICVDTGDNFKRLKDYLPDDCIKIFHILISHWDTYNKAEQDRLEYLEKRTGVRLPPHRKVPPSSSAELADYLEGFGNKTIFKSFQRFNKPITFIPISTVKTFNFPKNKNFKEAKKHFLWFGGGGAVLKGLDLCLEAFKETPDLHLHICGPIHAEKEFFKLYEKELTQTHNIHYYGRINVDGQKFKKIIDTCASVIYPSAGEGSSGAIVQVMHAGLIPIITHETGIQEDSNFIAINNPTPKSVRNLVIDFSKDDSDKLRQKSLDIWSYAKRKYTREEFSKKYCAFINKILKV